MLTKAVSFIQAVSFTCSGNVLSLAAAKCSSFPVRAWCSHLCDERCAVHLTFGLHLWARVYAVRVVSGRPTAYTLVPCVRSGPCKAPCAGQHPRESGDGMDAGRTAFHKASLGDDVGRWSDTAFYMHYIQCGQVRKCLDGGYWSQLGGGSAGPVYP